jgi:hypothetical protein
MHLLRDRVWLPFTYAEAKAHLIGNVMNQHYIMQGTDNVARWWGIVEQLHVQRLILDGRDFELQDSYLYIKIQNVHPLYTKEMIAQRDANVLAKSTLEYYLKLDKSIYVDKKKKRFPDGSNADCMQFVYNRLGIDLIRIFAENEHLTAEQRAIRYEMKYREMGMDVNGNALPVPPDTSAASFGRNGTNGQSPPHTPALVSAPTNHTHATQTGFAFGDDDDPLSKDLL